MPTSQKGRLSRWWFRVRGPLWCSFCHETLVSSVRIVAPSPPVVIPGSYFFLSLSVHIPKGAYENFLVVGVSKRTQVKRLASCLAQPLRGSSYYCFCYITPHPLLLLLEKTLHQGQQTWVQVLALYLGLSVDQSPSLPKSPVLVHQ